MSKNPMVEFLTIKRKVKELNKYINNSSYSRKDSLESFTDALLLIVYISYFIFG